MLYNFKPRFFSNLNIYRIIPNIALAVSLGFCATAFALPSGDQIAHGDVKINAGEASALHIHQHTEKAIINWDSFNIDAHEKVHFQQPVDGVCLNRINGANGMSQIHGKLSATGGVFLINPAGVLFGETARVNVGGLISSTIGVADQNFLSEDNIIFDQTSTLNGSIINRGVIEINDPDGGVFFLGASVADEGIIIANKGAIVLAACDKFTLDFYGDGVLNYAIEPVTVAGVDETGQKMPYGVSVSGEAISDEGVVFISARAAQGVFDNIINTSGVIRAKSTVEDSGKIILKGDDAGVVKVTGELNVAGVNGSEGGAIAILGENIILDDAAKLDVSGDAGEGVIMVGMPEGLGKNVELPIKVSMPLTYTNNSYVGPDVTFVTDAKVAGDAGTIAVMSTKNSTFLGKGSARGGEISGNGGDVLVYSLGAVGGSLKNIDTSAKNGHAGKVNFSTDPKFIDDLNKMMNVMLTFYSED